jgi:serine/threonine protein kinase
MIEWCDGGDLRHVIDQLHSQSYCLSKSFLRHAQLHFRSALVYLHKGIYFDVNTGICKHPSPSSGPWNQITHRDSKPDNVFLRWTNKVDHFYFPDLVIEDLGNAVTARPFVSVFQGMGLIEQPKWSKFCRQNYGLPEFYALRRKDDIKRGVLRLRSIYGNWGRL